MHSEAQCFLFLKVARPELATCCWAAEGSPKKAGIWGAFEGASTSVRFVSWLEAGRELTSSHSINT